MPLSKADGSASPPHQPAARHGSDLQSMTDGSHLSLRFMITMILGVSTAVNGLNPEQGPLHSTGVARCIESAWHVTWARFYLPSTHLFYDYLTSTSPGSELAHLPTPEEIARKYPNECGYGTGMEDCMISAGTMLSMIVDRYAVTGEKSLRQRARDVFQGIRLCATVHGVPGFIARGVCAADAKSIYPNSSRDQYTHAVHGLWLYARSPLCDERTRADIGGILAAVADRMTQNVTPENDYDSLRADGTRDTRGISRMWNVKGHEAARLPMIYAAAWDITGNQAYRDLCLKYLGPAVEQSHHVEPQQPTYALLQMQASLELLSELEQDPRLKSEIQDIMAAVAARCAERARNAARTAQDLDLTALCTDWRTGDGLSWEGAYRKVWYNIRERGEAALAQLMAAHVPFPIEQMDLLADAVTRLYYSRVSSNGIFYLQAAYWKYREKTGIPPGTAVDRNQSDRPATPSRRIVGPAGSEGFWQSVDR